MGKRKKYININSFHVSVDKNLTKKISIISLVEKSVRQYIERGGKKCTEENAVKY